MITRAPNIQEIEECLVRHRMFRRQLRREEGTYQSKGVNETTGGQEPKRHQRARRRRRAMTASSSLEIDERPRRCIEAANRAPKDQKDVKGTGGRCKPRGRHVNLSYVVVAK